ncbi:hypothetical protein RQP46_006575 [Phenoliferia psychrophenolica]
MCVPLPLSQNTGLRPVRVVRSQRTFADFAKASLHTVEDLQAFGNNWTPAPFWVRVISVTIPLATRLDAGKVLIDTLGEHEVDTIIGGREWWQRSANKSGGVTGEWIAMKKDWDGLDAEGESEEGFDRIRLEKLQRMKEQAKEDSRRKDEEAHQAKKERRRARKARKEPSETTTASAAEPSADDNDDSDATESDAEGPTSSSSATPGHPNEEHYSAEMDEMRCLLYIHGGAYFFGSINTHRYSIWRYARKMGGRAFAIHYRLAPQYPFPCALSDALASYLYLIRPPPGAKHKPVDPAKLTLAGDSAGGGLCLALLCLIRDSGLPAPAGAMLISPWCDLTHSFPSILENTDTDILPPYGFLFKPSTLWPPPPPEFQARADRSTSVPGLKEAHKEKLEAANHKRTTQFSLRRTNRKGKELAAEVQGGNAEEEKDPHAGDPQAAEGRTEGKGQDKAEVGKILKVKVDGEEVEVRDQIQLYATNEQLAYPFVSPVWQPSLGGLPPLYIMCGDKEVLRDEIVYLAHRAANPSAYPIRQALLDANPERTRKHAEYGPTKVHLQIYDDACHDLPLMSFTTPAKYCYRAISSFAKFVTSSPEGPTPSPVSSTNVHLAKDDAGAPGASTPTTTASYPFLDVPPPTPNGSKLSRSVSTGSRLARSVSSSRLARSISSSTARPPKKERAPKVIADIDATIYSSTQPFNRPPWVDNMVRERVAISGVVRPMEPAAEMSMLHLDPEDIGLVKESPVKRYLAGKAIWDKRFKRAYEKVQKRREHHLKKSMAEEAHRIKKRMQAAASKHPHKPEAGAPEGTPLRTESPEPMDGPGFDGIWNLHGERPPPSSIAARKDTMEARKLARVLDEHYSKLHALHLWSDVQEVGAGPHGIAPVREEAEEPEPTA